MSPWSLRTANPMHVTKTSSGEREDVGNPSCGRLHGSPEGLNPGFTHSEPAFSGAPKSPTPHDWKSYKAITEL